MPKIRHEIKDLKQKTQNEFKHINLVKRQISDQQKNKVAMMDKIITTETSIEQARHDNNKLLCEFRDRSIENKSKLASQTLLLEQLDRHLSAITCELESKLENKTQTLAMTRGVCQQKDQELKVARGQLNAAKGNLHIVEEKR